MVSQQILQIILKAKDEMSKNLEKIDKAMKKVENTAKTSNSQVANSNKQVTDSINKQIPVITKVENAYTKMKTTVNNAFNMMKTSIQNTATKLSTSIKESSLAQPFLNSAEKIKQKWQTTMEHIKSQADKLANTKRTINIDTKTSNIQETTSLIDKLKIKIGETAQKCLNLKNSSSNSFTSMSNSTNQAKNSINGLTTSISKLSSPVNSIKTSFASLSTSIKTSFNSIKSGVTSSLTSIQTSGTNAFSRLSSNVSQSISNMKTKVNADLNSIRMETLKFESKAIQLKIQTQGASEAVGQLNLLERTVAVAKGTLQTLSPTSMSAFQSISNSCSNAINTVQTKFNSLKTSASDAFNNIKTKAGEVKNSISNISSNMGMLSGTISTAFGMIGVSSLTEFTIGAARAREQITSVTNGITGSAEATKHLQSSIKEATSGGVVGFNKVAGAVNQIGLKYNLTNAQLEKTPPLLNSIGTYAMAMGKDGETAANWMNKSYDGLNGNFLVLQRNLGITKQQLIDNGWKGTAEDVDGYTQALQRCLEKKPEMNDFLNSFDGKLMKFKMTVQGVGREIGEYLLPILTGFLDFMSSLEQRFPGITKVIVILGLAIMALSAVSMIVLPIVQLVEALKLMSIVSRAAAIAQTLLNVAMSMNPIMIVVIAIVALIGVLVYLYNTNEDVRNTINAIGSAIMGGLQSAFNWLMSGIQWVIDGFNNFSSSVGSAVDGIVQWFIALPGNIYNCLESLLTTIGEWFSGLITNLITWGGELLNNIIQWFVNLPATISEYLNQLILSLGEWFSGLLTKLTEWGMSILTGIVQWLITLPQQFMLYLNIIILNVSTWAMNLYTCFVNSAWNAVTGFISWICQLPGQLWTWLMQTISTVVSWIPGFSQKGVTAGTDFLKGIIDKIKKIPSDIWTWLQNTISKVKTWIPSFVQKAQESARKFADKFKEKIKQLPQIMWDELMRIGDKIKNSVGDLVGKIKDLGRQMLDGFKNALGIHSPGYMYHAIAGEMRYLDKEILGNRMTLNDATEKLGESMIAGFNKAISNMNTVAPTIETPTTLPDTIESTSTAIGQEGNMMSNMKIPSEQIATDSQMMMSSISLLTSTVNPQLASIDSNLKNISLSSTQGANIVAQNNLQIISSYTQLASMMTQQLDNITNKNKNSWISIKKTTQDNLNSIFKSTKSVTTQMIQAWEKMKTSIISAAQQIKSQSEQRFNSLWNTIRTFYNRIRNPGGAGSPGAGGSRRGRTSNRSIGSVVRRSVRPLTQVQQNSKMNPITLRPLLTGAEIEYMKSPNSNLIATPDILRYFDEKGKGAGWSDIVTPNVNWIRNKTNEWKVNGPKIFGKYSTGNDLFKVKEFENGTPTISYDTFRRMAENVFSQCHYEFYWDSERYGNWVAAAHNGGMNCSDSTDFLIALAHACGLPASKVHGHWNQFGHYWANVAGHKMDTTGWMNRRTWTPAQSHAGSPSKLELTNSDSGTNDNITHSGEITLNLNLNIDGGNNLDRDSITSIVRETLGNRDTLKMIARNKDFQEIDANMKIKMNKSVLRNG